LLISGALVIGPVMNCTSPIIAAAVLLLVVHPAAAAKSKKPKTSLECSMKTASGLGYTMLKSGKGPSPTDQDDVTVKYRGLLATNGKQFDASERAEFPVGGLIPGFTEGLKLMKPGSKARFCIPPKLGYGAEGTGPIPANADLVFEVDLLAIKPGLTARAPSREPVAAADRVCSTKTASGLGYLVSEAGAGDKPTPESIVLVNYRGYLASDGSIFDANNSVPFPVKAVIQGFGEGLQLMSRGSRYKLCIPAAMAYGAKAKASIPANSDLVFDVDLLDFKSLAEIQAQKP
jgi:FKBP-type peptidyl-prolyl cis-trans isomerase